MFEDETCFEQVCVVSFTSLQNIVCNLQANLFEDYACKCKFNGNCPVFAHLMCPWKNRKTFFFGGQNMKGNFQQLFF